jgi:hypothetical protein
VWDGAPVSRITCVEDMPWLYGTVSHLGFVVVVVCPLPTLLMSPAGDRQHVPTGPGWCLRLDCALDRDPQPSGLLGLLSLACPDLLPTG